MAVTSGASSACAGLAAGAPTRPRSTTATAALRRFMTALSLIRRAWAAGRADRGRPSSHRPDVGRDAEVGVQLVLLVAAELLVLALAEARRAAELGLSDVGPVAAEVRVVAELGPGDGVAVVGEARVGEGHDHVGDLPADPADHQPLDRPGVPAFAVVDRRALDAVALDQRSRRRGWG